MTDSSSSYVADNYYYVRLPPDTCDGLVAFCRQSGITQAVFLQTAWAIVLGTFTGQEDVCFGYLASRRDAPLDGIEQAIGLLISMQVSRVRITGTIREVLQNMNRDVIAALEQRNVSLARIQSAIGLAGTSLFNTCMTIRRGLDDSDTIGENGLFKIIDGPERNEVRRPHHPIFFLSL